MQISEILMQDMGISGFARVSTFVQYKLYHPKITATGMSELCSQDNLTVESKSIVLYLGKAL